MSESNETKLRAALKEACELMSVYRSKADSHAEFEGFDWRIKLAESALSAPSTETSGDQAPSDAVVHSSDCAVHNAPAELPGPCDCLVGVAARPTDAAALGQQVAEWTGGILTKYRSDNGQPEQWVQTSVERLGHAVADILARRGAPQPAVVVTTPSAAGFTLLATPEMERHQAAGKRFPLRADEPVPPPGPEVARCESCGGCYEWGGNGMIHHAGCNRNPGPNACWVEAAPAVTPQLVERKAQPVSEAATVAHVQGGWENEFTAKQIEDEIELQEGHRMLHGRGAMAIHFKRGQEGYREGKNTPEANGDELRLQWWAGWVLSADQARRAHCAKLSGHAGEAAKAEAQPVSDGADEASWAIEKVSTGGYRQLPTRLKNSLDTLRRNVSADVYAHHEHEVDGCFSALHTSLATVRRMYAAARDRYEALEAAALSASQAHGKSEAVADILPGDVSALRYLLNITSDGGEAGAKPTAHFLANRFNAERESLHVRLNRLWYALDRASQAHGKSEAVVACAGCNGHGEVGGLRSDGYHSEQCPFCKGSGEAAPAADAAVVAQGWKLVPINPTIDMMKAGRSSTFAAQHGDLRQRFRAMAEAAPSNPSQSTGDSVRVEGDAVAWEYQNRYGDKFLHQKDPATWHPHERQGFKEFRALGYIDAAPVVHPDAARMDWLTEQLVDTICMDDGRIIDIGAGRVGRTEARFSPHDVRAAIDAALAQQAAPAAEGKQS